MKFVISTLNSFEVKQFLLM